MFRVGIIGVTGYVGIETLRILLLHPEVKITQIMTRTFAGMDIAKIYPHLANKVMMTCDSPDINSLIEHTDIIFVALPHGQSAEFVTPLFEAGKRIIDTGADFRLKQSLVYQRWYQLQSAPQNVLDKAVYGLPEVVNKQIIANALLLANPGCLPTAALIACMPALKEKIIHPQECIFDIKSGVSGSGRKPQLPTHFCEISEDIACYCPNGTHRHTPEIEQELSAINGEQVIIQLTPQVIPIIRGILATCYFKLNKAITEKEVYEIYQNAYKNDPFIRICPFDTVASCKNVRGTNFCDISLHIDKRTKRLIVVSAIDNLIKGAAGQAIQNMNLMFKLPETTGLDHFISMYP
ncbi:MAG: N-acetyl-gamma-glutamyl-phosphate reductase [Candidatus Berkiella sp.]